MIRYVIALFFSDALPVSVEVSDHVVTNDGNEVAALVAQDADALRRHYPFD